MKLGYTIVYVPDVAASLTFFENAFGLKRKFLHDSGTYGELDTGATTLSFAAHELGDMNFSGGHVHADTSLQPLISKKSVILRGVVSRRELDDLIHFSHALLLPISSGGGTNLKTAEAIVSNKTVICTTTALRGFENWAAAPGIYIEDENDAFARRAAETLKDSKIPKNWHRDSSSVTWPYTLNAAILSAERLAPMNRETDVTQ